MIQRMVRAGSRSVLHLGTITNGNALIQPGYVKVPHCQCARMFLSMFHSEEKSSGNGITVYMQMSFTRIISPNAYSWSIDSRKNIITFRLTNQKTINITKSRITMEKKPIAIHLKNFLSIPGVPPICLLTSPNC